MAVVVLDRGEQALSGKRLEEGEDEQGGGEWKRAPGQVHDAE